MSIFSKYQERYENHQAEHMTIQEYLDKCKNDKSMYASAAERMLMAIGEPEIVDTRKDERLSRVFTNRKIKIYPAFVDFYGMEETIEQIVSFFKHAAQGLEESKQILYLLGPVGGGKSSLSERLKELMQRVPIYTIEAYNHERSQWETSPALESPLGLFDPNEDGADIEREFGISTRYLKPIMSPWAVKRLEEAKGDISAFRVIKIWPSILKQKGITKVEPGDENNQDISSLVGKVNIRELESYEQHDPDAYNWAGGLNVTTQGILEFVEMFKAPIKMLHPLLTATQEGHYNGTEQFGAIPFQGVILAHCFSDDTQLLTQNGWMGIDDIQRGDVIATLNRDTGEIEYQPALNKYVYDHVDEMYHMSSSASDHLVTANHKMIYQSYGSYKEVLAEDFYVSGAKIPVSGVHAREDSDYYSDDNELRFHVWCVTDGHISYVKTDHSLSYRFIFKKERKIQRLLALLNELGMVPHVSTWSNESTCISISNVNPKFTKQFHEQHRSLSPRQTTILLEEWSNTDGTKATHLSDDGFQLSTNVPFHKDLIQELATVSGHKTTCVLSVKEGHDPVYMLCVRLNTTHVRCDSINKGTVSYTGKVWCLETENHTLIARRNGKIIITGNSNESEWQTFRNNKNNEAFLDRVNIVKVPYCLRVSDETNIYEKLISSSELRDAKCAPGTIEMMAQFSVLTRLAEPENSSIFSKMEIYDGKNLKDKDPQAKSIEEYRDVAGVNEGMNGSSTRFAFKILSKVFNYDSEEVAANPIHLMYVLEKQIMQEQLPLDEEERRISFIKGILAPRYAEFLGDELQKAYLESYAEYGQALFNRYIMYSDFWLQDKDYRDPDTGEMFDRALLNSELEKLEKPAGISNPKDFRNEVVGFVLRAKANNGGKTPQWNSYTKLAEVIEKKIFASTEELLPVISFSKKSSQDEENKHNEFVSRMVNKGYTPKQVRLAVEWFVRYKRHS